ncbi:hypothetical protein FKP32DRAFT_1169267 [Trametes sanguinea]|nr:hypothetical protein FKP32DRAFT_1169267 [Trametes sanguinea]
MHSRASFRFLDLPVELQIRILVEANAAGILACRKASCVLKEVIDNTVKIRYQLELAISGMVDGAVTPAIASTSATSYYALRSLSIINDVILLPRGIHSILYSTEDRTAPSLGFWVYPGIAESAANYPHVTSILIDIEEDLLVYVWNAQEPERYRFRLKCGFASLQAGNFLPHPRAPRPILTLCMPTFHSDQVTEVQGRGDLVALNARYSVDYCLHPVNDMIVFNWTTGTIVWHSHGEYYHDLRLVSSTQAVVVDTCDFSLSIFTFAPDACSDSPLSTHDHRICTLRLPERIQGCRDYTTMACFVAQAPRNTITTPGDPLPLFSHDPALTVLVLQVIVNVPAICDPVTGIFDHPNKHYLILIPGQTLTEVCRIARRQAPSHKSTSPEPSIQAPPTTVPWEEWGPSGSRIVHTSTGPFYEAPSMVGSQIAIKYWPWESPSNEGEGCRGWLGWV